MLTRLAVALATAVLAGCAAPSDTTPAEAALAALPACRDVPEVFAGPTLDAAVADAVPGLVLPPGAAVSGVEDQGRVVDVSGVVRLTPLQVRAHYEGREDVDLLAVEDEGFEAEVLLRAQGRRMFLRAVALCADGSGLQALVGPDTDDAGLPELGGGQPARRNPLRKDLLLPYDLCEDATRLRRARGCGAAEGSSPDLVPGRPTAAVRRRAVEAPDLDGPGSGEHRKERA